MEAQWCRFNRSFGLLQWVHGSSSSRQGVGSAATALAGHCWGHSLLVASSSWAVCRKYWGAGGVRLCHDSSLHQEQSAGPLDWAGGVAKWVASAEFASRILGGICFSPRFPPFSCFD